MIDLAGIATQISELREYQKLNKDQRTRLDELLVVRRIVRSHGGEKSLRRLFKLAEKGVSGAKIAAEFQVSRQCVNQWLSVLGEREITYRFKPSVRRLMRLS